MPETVNVAMSEIAEDVQEGLLALAVGTGLQVMTTMMNADVEAVCGPKGKHIPSRAGVRHGTWPRLERFQESNMHSIMRVAC